MNYIELYSNLKSDKKKNDFNKLKHNHRVQISDFYYFFFYKKKKIMYGGFNNNIITNKKGKKRARRDITL